MARVFPEDSPWLDKENVPESLEKIERYLRYMQERIEHKNYSDDIYNQRQNEELALVVKRTGTSVEINDLAIKTAAGYSGLETQIEQNANSITTMATNISGLDTRITQNANSITAEATDRRNADSTLQSTITAQANKIALVVQESSGQNVIKAAEIVAAVNSAGSSVKIAADHITLSGDVVMKSNLTDGTTQISGSNITTGAINANLITTGKLQAAYVDAENLSINGQNVYNAVQNATNAATADALNNTLSGFASKMLGYVNQAVATATGSNNGLDIGGSSGARIYSPAANSLNVYMRGNGSSISFTPWGQSLAKYSGGGTIKSFITVSTGSATYGIGLDGSTPTNGFVRVVD